MSSMTHPAAHAPASADAAPGGALAAAATSAVLSGDADTLLEVMRYPDLAALRERIAVLKRMPRNLSGYPVVRPGDCMAITDTLDAFLTTYERRFATGDAYVSTHFFSLVDAFRQSDIAAYPMEVLRLDLVKARALVACARSQEAIDLIGPYAQRPYMVEDQYGLLVKIIEVDTLARLSAGRIEELRAVSLGRLRLLTAWRPKNARALFSMMAPVTALGAPSGMTLADRAMRALARPILSQRSWTARNSRMKFIHQFMPVEHALSALGALIVLATRKNWHKGTIQIHRTVAPDGTVHIVQSVVAQSGVAQSGVAQSGAAQEPGNAGNMAGGPAGGMAGGMAGVPDGGPVRTRLSERQKPVLVTRAMGGLGDLAMMTPGINVLARRTGQPVYFATKKAFFPLFENNPDVKVVDVDSYFDVSQFRRWYNLSNCPATRYEAAHAPLIRKGRVETFAGGMSVTRRNLNRHGWTPIVKLSPEQVDLAARFRAEHARADRPLVGIQPFSRDTYKNCDAIFDAARLLSQRYRVVLMHTSGLPVEPEENIVVATGQPLRDVIALVSAMDYYIAVDSAFYHITAAFDIPTLGIFGPTDGRTLSRHHARYHLAGPPVDFACAPCWRNENAPCILTRNNHSACLNSITPHHIETEFETMRAKYPLQIPKE